MRLRFVVGAALGIAGCSVPDVSLEGKQCPCADGYACDTLTNRCLPANGDGGIIDTLAATECLSMSTNEVYRYAGTFDWQHEDATWSGDAEIRQTSSVAMDSYAYKTSSELTPLTDYRIITTMREVSPGNGTPAFGVVLRAQLDPQNKSRYACNWIPKTKELRLEATHGGSTVTIGSAVVATAMASSLTMEARVTGAAPPTLSCCVREYAEARLANVPDPDAAPVTTGYPGLGTSRMAAAFGSFTVLTP